MANVDDAAGWKALLAEPGGPGSRYDELLDLMRQRAGESGAGASERVLAGRDEPLAAIAVLRGPASCRPAMETAALVVARAGRKLAVSAVGVNPLSMLTILSVASIGETTGVDFPEPAFDVDRQIDRVVVDKTLSDADHIALAFLCLERGRTKEVRPLVSRTRSKTARAEGDPVALIETLAALKPRSALDDLQAQWDRFVRAFPAALQAETAEWRHLVLAARIILPKLKRAAIPDVAETLHRDVVELAGEASS